jgi:stearoyl-CoA desaturase (delta-9 desaturase)
MDAARGWDVDPYGVHSLEVGPESDPVEGRVVWDPVHSLWNGAMTGVALIAGPLTFSWSALGVFLALSSVVLIAGHSVGYHRRLIHRSFACPTWLERVLVWVGALVGLGGPLWTMRVHDLRDWGQRQADCHPALRHAAPIWTDYLWNLHGRLILARPPRFAPAEEIAGDRFLAFLERTWMLHQIPLALLLYAGGGRSWLVWGVCVRVTACVTGHWYVGRLAHRQGPQTWIVETSGVQAYDVPWAAIPTMGEAWHNNHHAFPGSAKMGLYPGQADWGFRLIQALEAVGLAWEVRTPETLPTRGCLTNAAPLLTQDAGGRS